MDFIWPSTELSTFFCFVWTFLFPSGTWHYAALWVQWPTGDHINIVMVRNGHKAFIFLSQEHDANGNQISSIKVISKLNFVTTCAVCMQYMCEYIEYIFGISLRSWAERSIAENDLDNINNLSRFSTVSTDHILKIQYMGDEFSWRAIKAFSRNTDLFISHTLGTPPTLQHSCISKFSLTGIWRFDPNIELSLVRL